MSNEIPNVVHPSITQGDSSNTSSRQAVRIGRCLVPEHYRSKADDNVARGESHKRTRLAALRALHFILKRRKKERPSMPPVQEQMDIPIGTRGDDTQREDPDRNPSPPRPNVPGDLARAPLQQDPLPESPDLQDESGRALLDALLGTFPEQSEGEDADGQAFLEALLGALLEEDTDGQLLLAAQMQEPRPPTEQAEPLENLQPEANNISNSNPEINGGVRQIPFNPVPARPNSSAAKPRRESMLKFDLSPPHESQDASSYIFDTNPRVSMEFQPPTAIPPPYATRYLATDSEPRMIGGDFGTPDQLYNMDMPKVEPLCVTKRGDGLVGR